MTGAVLVHRLEQFRRRDSIVRAVGIGMHAVCATTAAAVISSRLVAPSIAVVICALAAAAITVIATAVSRRPLDRIAAAIDRHAVLSDRVLTAFEHRSDTDPIAQLLLEDANRHAASVSPADVFPFRLPARIAWTAAAAAFAIVTATATPGVTRQDAVPGAAGASEDAGAPDGRGRSTAPAAPRDGRKSPGRQSTAAVPSPAPGVSPSSAVPRGAAQVTANATSSGGARAKNPPATASVSGRADAASDGQLRARAAGAGASNRSSRAAGALSVASGGTQAAVTPALTTPAQSRDVRLTSASASGQRVLAPGMRAYVRSYFDAIKK